MKARREKNKNEKQVIIDCAVVQWYLGSQKLIINSQTKPNDYEINVKLKNYAKIKWLNGGEIERESDIMLIILILSERFFSLSAKIDFGGCGRARKGWRRCKALHLERFYNFFLFPQLHCNFMRVNPRARLASKFT